MLYVLLFLGLIQIGLTLFLLLKKNDGGNLEDTFNNFIEKNRALFQEERIESRNSESLLRKEINDSFK